MILTKAEYLASIESLLPDNSTQEISPLDLRTSLTNLIDSVPNFFVGETLNTTNFSTPDTRTTKAGVLSLDSIDLTGRSSVDNSVFGYSAIRNNYDGSQNTAIGSYSLSCNLYGNDNTALGYESLVGNITGSGNVGLGSHTLHNNKRGSFNIAIGHGAGHYIGPEQNYTFSVGSIPLASGDLADASGNPLYSGIAPLMFGDLESGQHKLGIGTNSLHSYGMLQVSGDVSPTTSGEFNLGRSQRPWNKINDFLYFDGDNLGVGGSPSGTDQGVVDGALTVYGDLVPGTHERYALGNPDLLWDGYFNDVIVSGNMTVNDIEYSTITQCLYECKTLHLATSGFCDPEGSGFHNDAVCGYLSDQGLDGAGLEIHSSGTDYRRDYQLLYRFPDSTLTCLPTENAYTKSRWESNISVEAIDGASFIGQRLIGRDDTGLMIQSGCMGVFVESFEASGQRVVVAQEPHFTSQYPTLGDVSFIGRSGTHTSGGNPVGYDHTVLYGTVDSGVAITHKFSSRIKSASTVRGFSIVYHDELDQ